MPWQAPKPCSSWWTKSPQPQDTVPIASSTAMLISIFPPQLPTTSKLGRAACRDPFALYLLHIFSYTPALGHLCYVYTPLPGLGGRVLFFSILPVDLHSRTIKLKGNCRGHCTHGQQRKIFRQFLAFCVNAQA